MDATISNLLARCCRGDADAQRQLFQRYQSSLFAVCLRYARDRPEAQDLLQEAFLVVFRDLYQYKGEGPLEAWLRRVTVRVALQWLRRKQPLRYADDYADLPSDAFETIPDQELNSEAILKMVQQLPDGYRSVFNLHCVEGWSYPEIAEDLGIGESTVRSQYARACKQLRGMIERTLMVI